MGKFYTVIDTISVEITDEEIKQLKKENSFNDHFTLEDAIKELAEQKSDDAKGMGYYSTEVEECA